MPELPEVETIKNDLKKKILKKEIESVEILKKTIRGNEREFKRILEGNYFKSINRIGKLLFFELGNKKNFLLVHLKMTGQLVYMYKKYLIAGGHFTSNFGRLPNEFTRVILKFKNDSSLYFNDMRRFGYMEIVDSKGLEKVKARFGIEPLTSNFKFNDFKKIFAKRKAPVKAVLMNQKLIAGIGNIYADEILFESRIMPTRLANTLSEPELKRIFEASKTVLKRAIKYRGTTFRNYVDSEGKKGSFVNFLRIYGRKEGGACYRCDGIVKTVKIGGRTTKYCSGCQK